MKKFAKIFALILVGWLVLHLLVLLIVGLNDNAQKADAILIFGNKVEESGVPSERLQSRLDQGVELFNQGMASTIVVSGGLGKEGFKEAEVMKEYLVKTGIPATSIIVDNTGNNTHETAKNLAKIAQNTKIESVIIVSQYYHVLRAQLSLNKAGFNTTYSSYARMSPEFRDLYSIPREIIGYYAYLFK
jgi:uncharacterized SAM-binding protein YcdF (DUF218 family)